MRLQLLRFVTQTIVLVVAAFMLIIASPPASCQTRVAITFPEATGFWLAPLMAAQQQGFFGKHNIEVKLVPASGATVPRVSDAIPFGLIGAPAALKQVAHGTNLKLIASFYRARLVSKLVARPGISSASELRGKRVGVRVIGAGIWIDTVVALRQLQMEPTAVEFVSVGGPADILEAFEKGSIDAALLPENAAIALKAKGYAVLNDTYPPDLYTYEVSLVAASSYITSNADLVNGMLDSLVDAVKFLHRPENRSAAIRALADALHLSDDEAVQHYDELKDISEYPKPSLETLEAMQKIMAYDDPDVLKVKIDNLVDYQFLRHLGGER
jgi:ABC-type nitrate/sulfonate/bicarbonate transport system substrate-binding protein